MRTVDHDLDRILNLLRQRIRERGFTQKEVQGALGWGRSYVSQLMTRKKSLRLEHVLLILKVIGVKPEDFFGEIYHFGGPYRRRERAGRAAPSPAAEAAALVADLRGSMALFRRLVGLLKQKRLITAADLDRALDEVRRQP